MIENMKRPPTHPGEMLAEEFLKPLHITQAELAANIGVSVQTINLLVNGRRGLTSDMALRLGRIFDTSPESWINLQTSWDLWHDLHGDKAADIKRIKPLAMAGN